MSSLFWEFFSDQNNKNKDGGGFGVGTAFLLGAGAAAVGFLAGNLWQNHQQQQSCSSTGPRPVSSQQSRSSPGPTPTSSQPNWETKKDNLEARKKHRDTVRDQDIPPEMRCVVCFDNPREICLIPCGHVCLCEDCAEKVTSKCPMCQQNITNKKVIYI